MKTINDVFRLSGNELTEDHLRQAQSHANMVDADKAALKVSKAEMWQHFFANESRRFQELLKVDLAMIIAKAWNKHLEIIKCGDESRSKPTKNIWVALVDHKIKSTHEPHIDFLVGGIKQGELKFDVKLTLAVKGLELKIKAGRIMSFRIGSCKGAGEILLHSARIAKQETRELNFSGEFSLDEGIPIA